VEGEAEVHIEKQEKLSLSSIWCVHPKRGR
jgi:hypothetical protein